MLDQFKKHLQKNFGFLHHQKLLVAISGGMDSVALCYLLHSLNYDITLAHCNFQLRGEESHQDEIFVKSLAQKIQSKCFSIRFDTKTYCQTNKTSTQIGARTLRYDWFETLCTEKGFDFVLTAHHLNDVIETFFINLSRGTGIEGLTSIPSIHKNIIRPLLIFSKKELETFLKSTNITWREDQSNAETKYLRNKIRHHIVPELYKLNPNFENNFKRTLQNLYESQEFIQQKINTIRKSIFKTKNDHFHILKSDLYNLSPYEIYEVFKPYQFQHSKEILKLLNTQTGKEINNEEYGLLNNREELILYKKQISKPIQYLIKHPNDTKKLPISLSFSKTEPTASQTSILIDVNAQHFPFILRKRMDGDCFQPKGMKGQKKVSKFLKDLKLSKLEKEQTWLLCNQYNEIIWIVGLRADERKTLSQKNENYLYINLDFQNKNK